MQAPHMPAPQPNLVPVSFRPSRITHSRGVAGGASVDAGLPLTVKLVAIVSSREPARWMAAGIRLIIPPPLTGEAASGASRVGANREVKVDPTRPPIGGHPPLSGEG